MTGDVFNVMMPDFAFSRYIAENLQRDILIKFQDHMTSHAIKNIISMFFTC